MRRNLVTVLLLTAAVMSPFMSAVPAQASTASTLPEAEPSTVPAPSVLPLVAVAPAAAGATAGSLGNDVSWPQCRSWLPSVSAFAIVGVNGGTANTPNPCLAQQIDWAKKSSSAGPSSPGSAVQFYVNTANPFGSPLMTSVWPSSNEYPAGTAVANPYGECSAALRASLSCSYMYGYQKAYDDANLFLPEPADARTTWWLDVETDGTWSTNRYANLAVLEGMMDYFSSIRLADGTRAKVGLYSTPWMWQSVIGPYAGRLTGLDTWLPGASSAGDAADRCSLTGLTARSDVVLSQFIAGSLDYNYACGDLTGN